MTNTVNKAHFSRMCCVSKAAITKAEANGLIAMKDGKVNLDRQVTKDYLRKQQDKAKDKGKPPAEAPPKPPRQKPGPKAKPKTEQPAAPPAMPAHPLIKSLDDINEENIGLLTKGDVDKFKSIEAALLGKVKREELRGKLIKRSMVRRIFAQLYTIDVNQLQTTEDRTVPELCGVFGFQDGCEESFKARKLISDDISDSLRAIKRLLNDFLIQNKEEAI